VFTHDAKDVRSFRLFTSQLYLDGKVKQADLVRVFGVSAISVKRAVKLRKAVRGRAEGWCIAGVTGQIHYGE
jgi:hypothetical protein